MTVTAYLQKWLDHAEKKVNPKTHERYTQLIERNLMPLIGGLPLPGLRPLHIQDAYDMTGCSNQVESMARAACRLEQCSTAIGSSALHCSGWVVGN